MIHFFQDILVVCIDVSVVSDYKLFGQVEGLQHCEALEKLDLTLNFVDLQHLPSVQSLSANVHLHDLYKHSTACKSE